MDLVRQQCGRSDSKRARHRVGERKLRHNRHQQGHTFLQGFAERSGEGNKRMNRQNDSLRKSVSGRKKYVKRRSIARACYLLVIVSAIGVSVMTALILIVYLNSNGHGAVVTPAAVGLYFLASGTALLIVCLYAAHVIKKRLLIPIASIAETAKNYAADKADGTIDDFYFGHLRLDTGDEFEELSGILAAMELDISDSEQELIRATAERERMATELSVANNIQESMLPNLFPPYPERHDFEIYATMDPAKEVGGDFFDFFLIDDDHLALVMADVSGKGIPAALFMMSSMIIIDNFANMGNSPARVLELSNESICSMGLADMFVTVWFGILDLKTGVVTASNAGHEYPAICQTGGDYSLMKAKHGFVVGGIEGMSYSEYSFTLKPGASLFLYTDGVPEATDADNNQYGTDRMIKALNEGKDLPPKQLLPFIRSDINSFVKNAAQFDDLTMMCIRYIGPGAG